MRKIVFALLAVVCLVGRAESIQVKVSMDNAIMTNGGYWEGWGTSLCW